MSALVLSVALAACGGDEERDRNDDAGADATVDASGDSDLDTVDNDASDAGPGDTDQDTTTTDSGPTDTGPTDTGPTDTGPTDSGPADTGPTDTGPTDTGPTDTGPTDTGPTDTGPTDTGPTDTGPDTPEDVVTDTGSDLDPSTQLDRDLCALVNEYRAENGLAAIPVTPAMATVARAHAEDMELFASTNTNSSCNLHSWTDNQPTWSGCCYTSDHAQASCMWDKPRQVTAAWDQPFSGTGYEISAAGYGDVAGALGGWKTSSGHNNVILNLSIWEGRTWLSMGCGADADTRQYNVWFSDTADPNGVID